MRNILLIGLCIVLAAYVIVLQRRLQAARMRGDMYRDISARLDRRVAELSGGEQA